MHVCLFWGVGVALGRAGDKEAQERAQDDLELELQKEPPDRGAENRISILGQSRTFSSPLSHLSRLHQYCASTSRDE